MRALTIRVSSLPRLVLVCSAGGAVTAAALVASRVTCRPAHAAPLLAGGTSRSLAVARAGKEKAASSPTNTTTLKVEGMVCSKCTARVEKALIDAGVEVAKADLASGVVSVTGPGADAGALAAVVTAIGFPAVPGE